MIAWIRPSQLVALAWLVALVWAAPRARRAWAAAALAGVARVLAYGPDIHLHAEKAYHLLDTPFRHVSVDLRYGDGWPALMVLAGAVLRHGDTVHLVDTVASTLTVPFLFAAVAPVAGEAAALLAALLLAVLPLPVASADHEHQLVVVGLAQAAAVAGMLRGGTRRDDLLAATSIGMLAHSRPLQVVLAWLAVAWLGVRGRRAAALGAGGLVAWRSVELAVFAAEGGNTSGAQLDQVLTADALHHLVGPGARAVLADPTVTPLGVTLLALVGAWRVRRVPGGPLVVALLALDVALFVSQPLAPDRLRLQLPAQVWDAGLAGIGGVALARRGRGTAAVLATLVAASFVPARAPFATPWAWQQEYRLLRAATAQVPREAIVRVAHDGALAEWAARRTGARWGTGPDTPTTWRWIGLEDLAPGSAPPDPGARRPVVTAPATTWTDGTGPDVAPGTLGLYAPR